MYGLSGALRAVKDWSLQVPVMHTSFRREGLWMHVDAAYGFGTLFSDRLSGLLTGVDRADSVTLDLHTVGWQPAAVILLSVVLPCHCASPRILVADVWEVTCDG